MKKKLVLVCLVIFSTLTFGQTPQPLNNEAANMPGFYLDAGLGTSIFHADFFGYNFDQSGGFAGVLFLGYKINPYFAIEGGFNYLNGSGSSSSLTYFPVALKGILPLGEHQRFKLFGKIGPGFAGHNNGGLGTQLFFGLGGSYMLMSNLDLAAELNGISIPGFSSLTLLTINLIYHFG